MTLSVTGRMNIVKWMATTKDDCQWDARELRMLTEAAKRRNSDSFTKTGVRIMTELYKNPETQYDHKADKKALFEILVGEIGIDPAKLTGAQDADSFKDFRGLDKAGRFEFLKAARGGRDFGVEEVNTWDLPAVARRPINKKEAEIEEWADGYYREQAEERGDDMSEFTLEGAMEDDYFSYTLEKIENDGATYGYFFAYSYYQGEMGEGFYFDDRGKLLGEVDNGI